MGRVKTAFAEADAASPRAEKPKPGLCSTSVFCGLCAAHVDLTQEHLAVQCNVCGITKLHRDCAVAFLQARAKAMSNSRATAKMMVSARKHPQDLFNRKESCPNHLSPADVAYKPGSACVEKRPGSRDYQGRLTRVACPGFTQSAEVIKPIKELATPEPEAQPVRNKPQQATGAAFHKLPAAKKAAASTPTSTTHASTQPAHAPYFRGVNIVPAPGSGAGARLGAARGQSSVPGAGGGSSKKRGNNGGGGAVSRRRPAPLVMCPSLVDCGKCHIIGCEHAHSEEEQRERQAAWASRQQARRREAELAGWQDVEGVHGRMEEAWKGEEGGLALGLQAHHKHTWPHHQSLRPSSATSVTSSSSSPSATARPPAQRVAPPLSLSPYALHLLRSFKRSCCTNTLLDMGFSCDQAQAAAAATGCDLEAAAQMLVEGQACVGEKEPNLTRELRELTAAAAIHCTSPATVEAQLAAMGGNVDAVCDALRQGGCSLPDDLPATSVAISEPDTPSLGLDASPSWALDASSTHSLSPRLAGVAPPANVAATTAAAVSVPAPGVLSLADFSSSPRGVDGVLDMAADVPVASLVADAQPAQQGQPEWIAGAPAPLVWTPPEMDRQQPAEEEVDDLMQMLGIA